MRLEEGKTKIGIFPDKSTGEMVSVYYGNLIKRKDGATARLKDDKYQMFLNEFKKSEEYKKYDEYKEEQERIRQEKIAAEKAAQAAREAEFQRHKDELRAAGTERMEKQVSALSEEVGKIAQKQAQTELALENIMQGVSRIVEATVQEKPDPNEVEDDEDEESYEKGGGIGFLAALALILILILSLTSAGLSAYQLLYPTKNEPEPVKEDKTTITLDGQTYEIQSEEIKLDDGESVIQLYGIKSSENDGKVEKEIIPFGTVKIGSQADAGETDKKTESNKE